MFQTQAVEKIKKHILGPITFFFETKLEFSRQIFEKYSNITFHENPSSGSRVVPCGQTDIHDEANSRFFVILRNHLQTIYTNITKIATHCNLPLGLPEFLHNPHMKVAVMSALRTGRLYPPEGTSATHFC